MTEPKRHDPLCHVAKDKCGLVAACQCDLIAEVRADEREQDRQRVSIQMIRQDAVDGALANLRAKMLGLPRSPGGRWNLVDMVPLADVLALFEEKSNEHS